MNDLKIVLMNGGLGNQLCQYAFLRFLEVNTGQKCIVDDSSFWGENVEHNGLEIEKIFSIKLNKLSEFFSEDVWEEMIRQKGNGISIPQQLQDNGLNLVMIAESGSHNFNGNIIQIDSNKITNEILKVFVNAKGNIYYWGYFANMVYVKKMLKTLRQELRFPFIKDSMEINTINKRYEELIHLTDSVAVHIRRGDFLKCGRALSVEKYAKAIRKFEDRENEYMYFIFSDDIQWCKQNKKELGLLDIKGDYIFVEENTDNENNYIDMQLMSYCKNMIISNSSFGCWAFILNQSCKYENMIIVDNL